MKRVVGFIIAGILLLAFTFWVGWQQTLEVISQTNPAILTLAFVSTLLALFCWSLVLRDFLKIQGKLCSVRNAIAIFLSGTFANYITPLGQMGGEPFIALVLSKKSDASYEESYATIFSIDIFNMIPFLVFSLVGLFYFLGRTMITDLLQTIIYGLIGLVVVVVGFLLFLWYRRKAVQKIVLAIVRPVRRLLASLSHDWEELVAADKICARINNFYSTLDLIVDNKRRLLPTFFYSFAGWLFFTLPLFFVLYSLSEPLSFFLVLLIVPAASIAGLVPLPGGLGGVEFAMTLLLAELVQMPAAAAYSATLLYRFSSYWFAILIGGLASIYLSQDSNSWIYASQEWEEVGRGTTSQAASN